MGSAGASSGLLGGPARWMALGVGAGALFCAFVLPFLVPAGGGPVYSAAYVAGANNKAAVVGLAVLSVWVTICVTIWASGWGAGRVAGWPGRTIRGGVAGVDGEARLSSGAVLGGALLVAVWTVALGWAVARSGMRYGESSYFLERMRDVAAGGRIYRDLEFPYGPLLLLPPVWMAHVAGRVGLVGRYVIWLAALNAAGVWMAGYCVNRLPLSRASRTVLFGLMCLEQMHPLLGPNYSLGKFVLPFAVLLWGTGLGSDVRRAVGLAAGHLLVVLVSPELGVGLGAGIVGWAVTTAWLGRGPGGERRYGALATVFAPVAGYGVFLGVYGRGFLERLGHASAGALNLVIEPLPDMLIFLVAVVWLAPVAVGLRLRGAWDGVGGPDAARVVGVFLLALGLLPGALGRADPLHVFFNGLGFWMLAMVGIERLGRGRRLVWVGLVGLLGVQVQATNFKVYAGPLRALAAATRDPVGAVAGFDVERLRAATAGARVETPALLSMPAEEEMALRRAGLLEPDRVAGLAEIWDPAAEEAKIARMRQGEWVLVPAGDYTMTEGSPNEDRMKRVFRLGYRYPPRRQPYVVGQRVQEELATRWVEAMRLGDAVLYRRVR